MIGQFIGGLFGKVVENAEGILDKVITTDKERDEAKLALKRLLLEAETEALLKKSKTERALAICIKTMRSFRKYLQRYLQSRTLD